MSTWPTTKAGEFISGDDAKGEVFRAFRDRDKCVAQKGTTFYFVDGTVTTTSVEKGRKTIRLPDFVELGVVLKVRFRIRRAAGSGSAYAKIRDVTAGVDGSEVTLSPTTGVWLIGEAPYNLGNSQSRTSRTYALYVRRDAAGSVDGDWTVGADRLVGNLWLELA